MIVSHTRVVDKLSQPFRHTRIKRGALIKVSEFLKLSAQSMGKNAMIIIFQMQAPHF